MFRPLRLVPPDTKVNFIGRRVPAFVLSGVLIVASLALLVISGLNFGIDFRGGTLVELRYEQPVDIGELRSRTSGLGLGEIALQEFGEPTDVLVRIQLQEEPDGEAAVGTTQAGEVTVEEPEGEAGGESGEYVIALLQAQAEAGSLGANSLAVLSVLEAIEQPGFEIRRTEFVGPTVGGELIEAGTIAVVLAIIAILVYIWFRFEWQFGVCAVIALSHDVITTIGLFSLIQHEFNLATVAALLTIAGYSINDTVVVFDRVRENLRRYKKAPLPEVLNRSLNETLSRTVMTSLTTLLALGALYAFGGEIIRDFAFALIWGVLIGTYSSIFVAVPMLLTMNLRPDTYRQDAEAEAGPAAAAEPAAVNPAQPSASRSAQPETGPDKPGPTKPGRGRSKGRKGKAQPNAAE